jgi:hypothetical protein
LQSTIQTIEVEKDGVKTHEKVEVKKNTDEKALILIKVPQHEEEEEIKVDVPGEGQKVVKVKKMIDDDQKEKALAIVVRNVPNATFKNYFVINEFAGKAVREGFLDFINKIYPEFFDENDDYDNI